MTRATISIDGSDYPLVQVTVRRDLNGGEVSAQLAGYHMIDAGLACLLTIDGFSVISSTTASADIGDRTTLITATLATATGSGEYSPERIHYRSSRTIRGDVDFDVLPGDTHNGIQIDSVTHTICADSAWFTEVRF